MMGTMRAMAPIRAMRPRRARHAMDAPLNWAVPGSGRARMPIPSRRRRAAPAARWRDESGCSTQPSSAQTGRARRHPALLLPRLRHPGIVVPPLRALSARPCEHRGRRRRQWTIPNRRRFATQKTPTAGAGSAARIRCLHRRASPWSLVGDS